MSKKSSNVLNITPINIPAKFTSNNEQIQVCIKKLAVETSIEAQQKYIKSFMQCATSTEDGNFVAQLMSYIFLTLDSKHPIKKTITRVLLTMDEELVTSALNVEIVSLITDCESTDKLKKFANESEVFTNLSSCFNNFQPGVEALSKIINLVFIFACNNLLKLVGYLSENDIPKQNLYTYIYHVTKFLVALLNQCDLSQHMDELSSKLVVATYKIILDDHICFDTKSNCGILFIMATVHVPDNINEKSGTGSLTLLLKEVNDEGDIVIGKTLLTKNHTAKICIFSGILNVVPHELICGDTLDDVPAPIYIFQSLLESARRLTGKPSEIVEISRTFISLSRLLFHMQVEDIEVIFKPALDYIWTHLDHFLDTVRHNTMTVLKNFAKIAVVYEKKGNQNMILAILSYVNNLLANYNTNFKALSIISNETTVSYLLEIFPNLPQSLLINLHCSTIAPQACGIYETLMEQHSKENADQWTDVWVKELVPLIHNTQSILISYYQRIFIAAFKINPFIIKILCDEERRINNPNKLGVLLSCLVSARRRNTKLHFYCDDVKQPLWNGMIEPDLLDILLCHQTHEIRILALTLIVETSGSTELFSEWDLNYLIRYIHYNATTQQPHIRQQIVGLYKKAFTRFKESQAVITRNVKNLKNKVIATPNNKELNEMLKTAEYEMNYYNKFIHDIFEKELVRGLCPDANFPRRSTCLELLLFMKHCVDPNEYLKIWRTKYLVVLYQVLNDSYESNIIMATKILLELPNSITYYQSKEEIDIQIKNCLSLASSIKPCNTITAAYLLQVYKHSPKAMEVLCNLLRIPYLESKPYTDIDVSFFTIQYIFREIEKALKIAEFNVLTAARETPIYGLLYCVRHLIEKEHFDEVYPKIVSEIVELCGRISQVVSPIVNNSSPEGYLPTDYEIIADETVTSQMVLVFAWRTVKEIALMLGELTIRDSKSEDKFIAESVLNEIAEYFITLFMETKHRGAYEQAYFGFSKFCAKLWNSDNVYDEWPIKWLNMILNVIDGKQDNFEKICSTRRSAGIPFMIQAILTTESPSRNHESFHYCMKTLLQIAENTSEENEKSRTHSMNILRALYKHNQLGELVTPYVGRGVMIAVIGFSNPVWGVRNTATLLFSALMTRMFGVQRTKDEEQLSIKNRLSAKVFFMRHPELYEFILEKLKEYTINADDNVSLYPLLFILARLYPTGEKTEMLQYLPFINNCLGSSIYKTRELAAQASISAMSPEDYPVYIQILFKSISNFLPGNLLHGKLLQLKLLLKYLPIFHGTLDAPVLARETFWLIWAAGERVTQSSATLYMEVIILLTTRFRDVCYGRFEFKILMDLLLHSMSTKDTRLSTAKKKFELTRLTLYMHLFGLVLDFVPYCREKFFKDTLFAALNSAHEDIQIYAVNCMNHLFKNSPILHENSLYTTEEIEISELEYDLIESFPEHMKFVIVSAISAELHLQEIFSDLFHTIKTKTKDLSLKILLLLPYFPCIINSIRPKHIPVILEKQVILDFLVVECLKHDSDMFCAILPIISKLCSETKQKMKYKHLIQHVLKPFSTDEFSTQERLAVSNFFVQNPKFLYDRTILPIKHIVESWYIVLNLLQDADEVVRYRISEITYYIESNISSFNKRNELGIFVIPQKSLEELIYFMPELIPFNEAMKIYLSLALKPKHATKIEIIDTAGVFDKGELNVYQESDPMADLSSKCLKMRLWELEDGLNYKDKSIFIEEHTLLVATNLFNLFHGYHISYTRSEDKLLSMLVLKEVITYLEQRSIDIGDFKNDFMKVLDNKFLCIFAQSSNMFRYCRVENFLKYFFSFE